MNPSTSAILKAILLCLILANSYCLSATGQQVGGASMHGEANEEKQVRILRLAHADGETVLNVLQSVMGDKLAESTTKMAIDGSTNSLILASDEQTFNQVQSLVKLLDNSNQHTVSEASAPVNLVVQLIMNLDDDEKASHPSATPVDARVREILAEASDNGLIPLMKQPRTVIHSLIRVNPGAPNTSDGRVATGNSAVEGVINLNVDGNLHELESGLFQLGTKIQIVVQQQEEKKMASAQIQTETTIQKNHPVLLSVNTIQGLSFVIIVEVR